MKAIRYSLLFLLLLESIHPQLKAEFSPVLIKQESKSSVYFFRLKGWPPSALEPIVYCDDVALAHMDNGRYFVAKLNLGKHVFRTEHMKDGITVDLESGKTYYFEIKHVAGFPMGHGRLNPIEEKSGEALFRNPKKAKLKLLSEGKVLDRSKVVVESNGQKKP